MNLVIYLVDDHEILVATLGKLIESFETVRKVVAKSNPLEFLKLFEEEKPDVVIIDYDMPEMNGFELSEIIVKKYPNTKIIMLTMHDNLRLAYEAIELGVHGFLLKNTNPDELKQAIESVIENDFFHNEISSNALRKGAKANKFLLGSEVIQSLTQREKEVLTFICDEFTMKEISERLTVSENTIKNHRQNLQKKLKVNNPVGLVKKAIEIGFYKI